MISDGGNTAVASRVGRVGFNNQLKGTRTSRLPPPGRGTYIHTAAFPVAGPLTQHATVTQHHGQEQNNVLPPLWSVD